MAFNFIHYFIITMILLVKVQSKAFNNTVYVISNTETPSLGPPGLTPVCAQRAQECLPLLFVPLDVGIVVTCPFDPDSGKCSSTTVTATPIADALGPPLITSCGADEKTDDDCIPDLLKNFAKNSTQSMLVVWDLGDKDSLFENLDVDDNDDNDDDENDDDVPHYDVLTVVVKNKIGNIVFQGCPGIDGQAPGTFRRRHFDRVKKRTVESRVMRRYA